MEEEDVTLYETLGLDPNATDVLTLTDRDISRAYRKAALKWHPDKNRGDAQAATKFSEVFIAYETLISPPERAKIDAAIRAVRSRRERFQNLDETRKQLKSELYRREAEANATAKQKVNLNNAALKRMQREIERLRQEALRPDAMPKPHPARKPRYKPESSSSAGEWANVVGYEEFRSPSSSGNNDFDIFEQAVLSGTNL